MTIAETPAPVRVTTRWVSWLIFVVGSGVTVTVSLVLLFLTTDTLGAAYSLLDICVVRASDPNVCDYSFINVTAIVEGLVDLAVLVATAIWFRRRLRRRESVWWLSIASTCAVVSAAVVLFIATGVVAAHL